ncbi:hypothetical protein OU489_000089 [Enterococcus hirae]|uniref:immunoglobulin-like domain-containing protein n=1 Tax=Enterococcus hirae TaxID=1354 RepID=UPI001965CF33|nr:immunoglobulin-like domain-containing protein [Enterococcus hirae]EMF0048114.1 hypothetical protein [Enterococcus hirae]EMF0066444.1 hypothetical protein [Enterococcus hirae]EMF0105980.1 hypothetical protein [Enterococcus hirae]EMF0116586.1 hypothetical protein [Enterococcus hirae]EMF0153477.1 hypothetical protein [Enterococcus hirae]
MGKKNLSKSKKLRKQLLAASAAGLVLVSSVAGPGMSMAYAQETTDQGKTETSNLPNKETQSSKAVTTEEKVGETKKTEASLSSETSVKATNNSTEALQYAWNNFPSQNGPFKSGYTVKWPTLIGARYKVVLTYATRGNDPINFNVNAKDVKVENSFTETSNPPTRHYTTTLTFVANTTTTDCKVTWTGYGPEVAGSTIGISASSNAPQSLLEHSSEINGYMSAIFKADGSLQEGVNQAGIEAIRRSLQPIVPQDSGYWKEYIAPNLQAAEDLLTNSPQQITNTLNSLYSSSDMGIDKPGLTKDATQSAFDNIQKQIDALPDINPVIASQKPALQAKLNDLQAMLQEIQIKSSTGQIVAQIDANPHGVYVRTFAGQLPGNNTYGSIQITQPKYTSYENLFKQEYKGGTYQNTVSQRIFPTFIGSRGATMTITTTEAPLTVNKNVSLSNTVSKSYTFKLNDQRKWNLQSSSYDNASNAVNSLFDGDTPKANNTQDQINQAKNQVNNLLDGTDKTELLAKITTAQQALDAATAEEAAKVQAATEAVNALFNGDTPKPENTQEQINAAKAKVDALKDGQVKTELLEKIQKAQDALVDDPATIQAATETVNALFNGDTPKPENTQEQINAAKAKVDALKASETKTELLAKIQKAQEALEEKSKQTLTLNPYTLGDQYVTGTITGNIKKFQLIVNGQTYEPGFKLKNGKLEVYVGNRVPEGTTEFTLKAFNPAGTQVASQTVQVQAPSLSVDKFVLGSEYMTGSYQGNSINKFRLTVDGKVYEPGFKLENGKFEVYIGSKITGSSKVIKLEALDKAGKTIVEQNVTVEAPQLTINEYIRGNEYLTGTVAGEGVKKFKLIINGQESFPGFKLTAGKFEIYVGNKVPANVNSIKVVGIDKTGQEIVSQDVNVQNPELQPNEYLAGNEYVTGTFTGQAIKKFKLVVNGQENYPGFKITEGNKFEVYIGNKVPVGTTTFTLIGLDKSGQQLTSKEITVQSPTLSINEYVRGDEYMRGTFNGDGIKKFKLVVDGQESNPGFKITGENQFEVYIGNKITADSKSIKLEGLDKSGNVLVSQEVSVSQPELVPNEYTRNSEYLTGTYKGDIRSIKLTVDNKEYKPGFKLKEGNQFEVYIGNKIPASANSFTIESLSFDGKQLVSVNVPVK